MSVSYSCTQCCMSFNNPKIVEFASGELLLDHLNAHEQGNEPQVLRDIAKLGKPVNQAADMARALASETLPGGIPRDMTWEKFKVADTNRREKNEAEERAMKEVWAKSKVEKAAQQDNEADMPPLEPLTFKVSLRKKNKTPNVGSPQPASPKKRHLTQEAIVSAANSPPLGKKRTVTHPEEVPENRIEAPLEEDAPLVQAAQAEPVDLVQAAWANKIAFKKAEIDKIVAEKDQIIAQNIAAYKVYKEEAKAYTTQEDNFKVRTEELLVEEQLLERKKAVMRAEAHQLGQVKENLDQKNVELAQQEEKIKELDKKAAQQLTEMYQIENLYALAKQTIRDLQAVLKN